MSQTVTSWPRGLPLSGVIQGLHPCSWDLPGKMLGISSPLLAGPGKTSIHQSRFLGQCIVPILLTGQMQADLSSFLVSWGPLHAFTLDTEDGACVCVRAKSLQLCPTLCDPIDCIPPGSSVRGISQARILEWGAIFFSRGSSQPRG